MRPNYKYYFTVEGETEQWYLQWLQSIINAEPSSIYTVIFNCPIQKDPLAGAKKLIALGSTEITHIFDCESNDECHKKQFQKTLDRMKDAQDPKLVGKKISYLLGYSNFTFELWMVLHKSDCNGALSNRTQYLEHINKAYSENFEDLDHYKKEAEFKRMLKQLTLSDVKDAIKRAKIIMDRNAENGLTLHEYKKWKFYCENPSLSIWESIKKILGDCNLL